MNGTQQSSSFRNASLSDGGMQYEGNTAIILISKCEPFSAGRLHVTRYGRKSSDETCYRARNGVYFGVFRVYFAVLRVYFASWKCLFAVLRCIERIECIVHCIAVYCMLLCCIEMYCVVHRVLSVSRLYCCVLSTVLLY